MNEYSYAQYIADLMRLPYGVGALDFHDPHYKDNQANIHVRYMLDRVQSMFTYEGLPDTIPQRNLELILQTCGNVCITDVPGKGLYAMWGGLGGEPDPYYLPTLYTVANPGLQFDANLKIGIDCVWGRSDSCGLGLMPLFQWYASMIVESGISMRVSLINSRISRPISAQDDRTEKSAHKYLEDIEDGKLGVIANDAFFEGLKIDTPNATGEHLTDIIEVMQYLKASWFNDLGLNANYNMKRERIQNAESQLNTDALLPLVDDMLRCREQMLDEVNALYGTNITVRLNSAWRNEQISADMEAAEDPGEDETGEDSENVDNVDKIVDNKTEDPEDETQEPAPDIEGDPEGTEGEPAEIDIDINITTGDDSEIITEETGEEVNENVSETESIQTENDMDG